MKARQFGIPKTNTVICVTWAIQLNDNIYCTYSSRSLKQGNLSGKHNLIGTGI